MVELKKVNLGDIITFKNGKKKPAEEGTIPIYGGNGILGYTDRSNYKNCIAVGRVGAYCGSVYYEPGECWISDNAIAATPKADVDIYFAFYLLKSLNLNQRHIGTSQPLLTQEILNKIECQIPDLDIQKKISNILRTMDGKVECNTAINRNLQEQISTLYQAWFIDFLPFADGEFVESQIGRIPVGWKVKKLGELCDTISKKHSFEKEKLIFLNTGDIEDGRFIHANYSEVKDMPGQAKKTIREHDILYSEIRPVNKHFAYVNFKAEDYVVSTKLMVIRSKSLDPRRLYQYLTSQQIIDELQLEAESRSGTFPQIRFENVSALNMLVAPDEIEKQYADILHIIYEQIDKCVEEIQHLLVLRDAILPKLMSGEMDVSDIDI